MKTKVLVGTLALDNIGITEGWLRSLYANTNVPDDIDVDVLIVDNGSQENIGDMVKTVSSSAPYDTYFLRNPRNLGVAPGWNQILRFAPKHIPLIGMPGSDEFHYEDFYYRYYVISNNDIWFGPDWLVPLVRTMERNGQVGWASSLQNGCDEIPETKEAHHHLGRFRIDPHLRPAYNDIADVVERTYAKWGGFNAFCQKIQAQKDKPEFHNGHSATCFIVNTSMIRDLGYFNESHAPIGLHEDHEYWERMDEWCEGRWQYKGVNDSIVHHHVCMTRKGPGFGSGHEYEVQREKNWRERMGRNLFGLPGE